MVLAQSYNRIIIQNIYPQLDGGRYPVKRVVGDRLDVWAEIFSDGHDLLNAVLSYQAPGQVKPEVLAFKDMGNDNWHASFELDVIGKYTFSVTAWTDRYGSWIRDTKKKKEAGQSIDLELQEGKSLLERLLAIKVKPEPPLYKVYRALLKKGDIVGLESHLLGDEIWPLYTQYGPRENEITYQQQFQVTVDRKLAEFSAWYEMFPRSQGTEEGKGSTFADCERRLDDIQAMGFDVVYFPPIHPIGQAFRKGKNNSLEAGPQEPGSPYAIGSKEGGHKAIHPELGTLQDFKRFIAAAQKRGMDVALDFAVQVSPDHPYITEHPEWFSFRPDGSLKYAENPPKKYQDIANVNFDSGHELWKELASIIEFWIEQGITIFRVDNPHTKPFAFWEWLIATVQEKRPDIIFLAEAFTRPKVMYLLAKAGFTQSYSYFTWRNSKQELAEYLTELTTQAPKEYFRPNFFPTTPDIFPPYLHNSGRPGFIIRLALAATLAGNYGMYNGYELCEGIALPGTEEYADSEKYEYKVRDWNKPGHIKEFITKLNAVRRENPALQGFTNLRFYHADNDQVLFYGKMSEDKRNIVFIAVNLDPFKTQDVDIEMPLADMGISPETPYKLDDLLLGHSWEWVGSHQRLQLMPERNPIALFRVHRS